MIVCEKLRAICQQTPEYAGLVKRRSQARARDFLDIHDTIRQFRINLTSAPNRELLRDIFRAKRVELALLGQIRKQLEFHRQDWPAVQASVRPGIALRPFDFYFDFVVEIAERLKALGDV